MEKLNYSNGIVTWKEQKYELNEIEVLDDNSVHLILKGNAYCFIGGTTEINGVVCKNSNEILNALK